jgi:flotillin
MGQKYTTTYEIADVNEFVVTTGFRVKDGLKVSKSTIKFPFQKASRINVQPHNYEFSLHAMSCEKLQFVLPGVFTIGVYLLCVILTA